MVDASVNFWRILPRVLPFQPARTLGALYWHLTRRKVRAWTWLRAAAAKTPLMYNLWIDNIERKREVADLSVNAFESWGYKPHFSIVVHTALEGTQRELDATIESIKHQIYPDWSLLGVERGGTSGAVGDGYLVLVRAGGILSRTALFRIAEALQVNRSAAILYGDQDEISGDGQRIKPWFKPHWNREMFLALDYISAAVAIESDLARRATRDKGSKGLDSFLLAATEMAADAIVHVPHILSHLPANDVENSARIGAVAEHILPLGATCTPGPYDTVKIEWPLPTKLPLVSIIVSTRDKADLLQACLESVLNKTSYREFEVLIVDNGSTERDAVAYLQKIDRHPQVEVLPCDMPYNFSTLNNFAASRAKGDYLCLLNNDTEVVTEDWLTEMIRYGVRADVGAVGAKLLYPDGSIQHAGVVIGIGGAAGHAHRLLPADQPGYFRQPHVAQFVSAVTGACLLVRRDKFVAVGGLDEALAVAFNDVDLCLKLEAAGWRNVYVPHAVLLHHESKSRGSDMSSKNIKRFQQELNLLQEKWGTKTYIDPLHNPNLDKYSETFVVGL